MSQNAKTLKIVVLDGYVENPGDISWRPLEDLGQLTVYDRTSYEESGLIAERIGDADIVVTNKTPISRNTIDKCPSIKAVAVLATGYNVVDCVYAREKGIDVMNVPGYGTQIVAQYTAGLLLEICAHYGHHDRAVKEGRWEKHIDFCFWDYPMIELSGKTAGIIGMGRIGKAVAGILKAMGMKVIAHNSRKFEDETLAEYAELDRLFGESDVILLHCPLTDETAGIINKKTISKMKDGVIIINTGRGALIDEHDLAEALNSGKVYAAGVDVVSTEPVRGDNPLLTAKNCFITPHIAWAAKEARQRIMDTTAGNIKSWMDGQPVNVVNK